MILTTHVRRALVIAVDRKYPVGGVHVPPSGDGRRDVGHTDGPRVGLAVVEDLELVVVGVAVELRRDRALEPVDQLGEFPTPRAVGLPEVAAAHVHQDEDLLALRLRALQLAGQPLQLVSRVRPVIREPAENNLRMVTRRFLGWYGLLTN